MRGDQERIEGARGAGRGVKRRSGEVTGPDTGSPWPAGRVTQARMGWAGEAGRGKGRVRAGSAGSFGEERGDEGRGCALWAGLSAGPQLTRPKIGMRPGPNGGDGC